jgi:hypothetical protein
LLVAEVVLWIEAPTTKTITIGLLEKILATAAVMVVLLGGPLAATGDCPALGWPSGSECCPL